jgi:hypothetical protein
MVLRGFWWEGCKNSECTNIYKSTNDTNAYESFLSTHELTFVCICIVRIFVPIYNSEYRGLVQLSADNQRGVLDSLKIMSLGRVIVFQDSQA